MKHRQWAWMILATAALTGLGTLQAGAADVTVGADVISSYMWRGLTYNDEGVIQPSADISHESGLGLNVWANLDVGDYNDAVESGNFSEIDLALSYAIPVEGFDLSVGWIEYTFPQAGPESTTRELYVSSGVEVAEGLSLTLDVYYDFDEVDDFYGVAEAGYSKSLTEEFSLALSASIGYAGEDFAAYYAGGTDAGFFDWNARLDGTYVLNDNVELGVFIAYTDNVDSDALPAIAQDTDWYGGGSVYYSF